MYFKDQKIYHIDGTETDLHFPDPLNIVHMASGRHKQEMLELYCGFDTETTTITTPDGDHQAFVYHFQLSIGTPRILNVYLFRRWEVFLDFLEKMIDHYKLGPTRHMILSVANFGFEFSFLAPRLQWDCGEWDFFAKEKYKPLKATYKGIEFREVLSLTGGNLAQLAKDYCHTQKLVTVDENGNKISDLDYKKLRNSSTPLTALEEQYCINDVVILSEFMWYLFCEFIRPDRKMPMTFTSILHNEIKQELKDLCFKRDAKQHQKNGTSYDMWMDYIYTLQPHTEDEYHNTMTYLFAGGYVHANALFTGVDGLKAGMMDITSFYPTQMNLGYVPVTPFKACQFSRDKLFNKCLILHVIFDYVRPTTTHTIISKNKIISSTNARFDNGRLISADMIEVMMTELDLLTFRKYYTACGEDPVDNMTVLSCQESERGELPVYVRNVLNKHYQKKEKLKRTGYKETMEYAIAKARCNSVYGDLVKRVRRQRVLYNNEVGWVDDPAPVDYEKEIRKNILSPYWGIWCTSWCRFTILGMIYKLTKAGVKVLYCDTDSIKYIPCHKATQMFKHFNNSIKKHRHNRKLRSEYFEGLGEFDIEVKDKKTGKMIPVDFKTLRSKCYIYAYGGKVFATVAGMPKAAVNQLGRTPEEVIAHFNKTGFRLTPQQSSKLTTSYTDTPYSAVIDGEVMRELSGVALYEIPFKVTIKEDYLKHIEALQKRIALEEKYL